MTYFNPISGSVLSSTQIQQQLAADKTQQLRRAQAARRNVALASDRFEHTVENAEAVSEVSDDKPHEEDPRQKRPRKRKLNADEEGESHLDVKG